MTVTAAMILERLEVLIGDVDESIAEADQWARVYASARPTFEKAKASAIVRRTGDAGTVAEKDAGATLDCSDEMFARWESEVLWKNATAVMKARETIITAIQTWARNVVSERDAAFRGPQVRP